MSTESPTPAPTPEEKPAAPAPAKAKPAPEIETKPSSKRKGLVRPILFAAACVALVLAALWIIHSFRTVSTDDAYVNSYVTFVAPRVTGQVSQVLV